MFVVFPLRAIQLSIYACTLIFVKMRICLCSGVYKIALISVLLFYSSECIKLRVKYFRLYKNYYPKLAIFNSSKLNNQKSPQNSTKITFSNNNYLDKNISFIKIYTLPILKFVRHPIPKGNVYYSIILNFLKTSSSNMLLEKFGRDLPKKLSFIDDYPGILTKIVINSI